MALIFLRVPIALCRLTIWLGYEEISSKIFATAPPRGLLFSREYEKSRFSINISFYLGNDTRYDHNYK